MLQPSPQNVAFGPRWLLAAALFATLIPGSPATLSGAAVAATASDLDTFNALGGYAAYLAEPLNSDLRQAGVCDETSAFEHWRDHGQAQGRDFAAGELRSDHADGSPDSDYAIDGGFSWHYPGANTVVFITADAPKPEGWAGRQLLLERCQTFNLGSEYSAQAYRNINTDVGQAIDTGAIPGFSSVTDHYVKYGFKEGRLTNSDWVQSDLNAWSDADYFSLNADVQVFFEGAQSEGWIAFGKIGFAHWINFGRDEVRSDGQPVLMAASYQVEVGFGVLIVSGAEVGVELAPYDEQNRWIATGVPDAAGGFTFAGLGGGGEYRVRHLSGSRLGSAPLRVFGSVSFDVRESVEQLHVTHATPGVELTLETNAGAAAGSGTVDAQGSLVFRQLDAAEAYRILDEGTGGSTESLSVMSVEESLPAASFYSDQLLNPGFNYIRTRDGTTLSAYVTLPGPIEEGPYPTLVSYSGYAPSKPGEPLGLGAAAEAVLCDSLPTVCDAPNHPAGVIGGLFGFATVGVNMRGTGCSGGAYDFFETLQVLDGYDLIEVVAAQSWVLHNHVGMAGLSYPGISQLFTAQAQPPSLAAITPLSVIANTAASVLAPGGIFNDGFAFQWAENVFNDAAPYGQGWEADRVAVEAAEGADTCAENQLLHGQALDPIARALENPYYVPEVADPLNPSLFADRIEVPLFLTGAWQDEQTGPHFATLLDRFVNAPVQRFTVFNGLHSDGYSPATLAEWKAFLDIYVARRVPIDPQSYTLLAPMLFVEVFGQSLDAVPIPFQDAATLEDAEIAYEAQPRLRVILERGGDSARAGMPSDGFEKEFSAWPPTETQAWRLYLHEDGSLGESEPTPVTDSASKFEHDPEAGQRTLGGPQPFYHWPACDSQADPACVSDPPEGTGWAQPGVGKALVFEGAPLAQDVLLLGSASVDLWLKSNADDADLEVSLIEVRADGNETYVQSGWLRASHRTLAADATELRPVKTHLESDASPLPAGQYELVRVEVMPFAHVFRAGSSIRLEIDTPGDNRELWRFQLTDFASLGLGVVEHQIAHSATHPSSVVLPLIPGEGAPAESTAPACPGLRGQACRPHEGYGNTPGR